MAKHNWVKISDSSIEVANVDWCTITGAIRIDGKVEHPSYDCNGCTAKDMDSSHGCIECRRLYHDGWEGE